MRKIMITGALEQIGTELVIKCRGIYRTDNVLATDIRGSEADSPVQDGLFGILNVTDRDRMFESVRDFEADSLVYMAALLPATAEKNPILTWDLNIGGLTNVLEAARTYDLHLFTLSSIDASGGSTPKVNTPQVAIQRPVIMYGINKVAGELLCQYYFKRFGVDARSVRFPGLISHVKEPDGDTIGYAVEIYFRAVREGRYTSFIDEGIYMDMMYIDDAIEAIIKPMETDDAKLETRNGYNLNAMSFDPEMVKEAVQEYYPNFILDYDVGPIRQGIANNRPNSIDTSCSRGEWGFDPKYDLVSITKLMLEATERKDTAKNSN